MRPLVMLSLLIALARNIVAISLNLTLRNVLPQSRGLLED